MHKPIFVMLFCCLIALFLTACWQPVLYSAAIVLAEITPAPTARPAQVVSTTDVESMVKAPTPLATAKPLASAKPLGPPSQLPQIEIKVDSLNVREGPGTNYPVKHTLRRGERLPVLGQYHNCLWLKVTSAPNEDGWISGASTYIVQPPRCDHVPYGVFRPLSGALIKDNRHAFGQGALQVDNGTRLDGVITLTRPQEKTPSVAFYVRAQENFTLSPVPDGTYTVAFTTGSAWDAPHGRFTQAVRYQRFEQPLAFTTALLQSSAWSITLHPVPGGTGKADAIESDEFPDLSETTN